MTPGRLIYVAGGSSERLTVIRPILAALTAAGWTVTYDWTQSPGYDRQMSAHECAEQAELDLAAVAAADVVWVVVPEGKSEGAAVEFGTARALRKHTIVSGARPDQIFYMLADIACETHALALEYTTAMPVGAGLLGDVAPVVATGDEDLQLRTTEAER